MMDFIATLDDIIQNIKTIERYLTSKSKEEKLFATNLLRNGKTNLIYLVNGKNHFAPSRFLGYKNNTMQNHLENEEKDGRDTNPIITNIVGRPFYTDVIEKEFIGYVESLQAKVQNNKRKYWRVRDGNGKHLEIL